MKKVNIGSGPNLFLDGWINLDREDMAPYIAYLKGAKTDGMPDAQARLAKRLQAGEPVDFRVHDLRHGLPYATETVDRLYLGQVIEHLNPVVEVPKLLKECRRVLKPDGILRIATPDLDLLVTAYINSRGAEAEKWVVKPGNPKLEDFADEQPPVYRTVPLSMQLSFILFGALGPKTTWDHYEGHMMIYSRESMEWVLKEMGFGQVRFYPRDSPQSDDPALRGEVVDTGVSHSLLVDARK